VTNHLGFDLNLVELLAGVDTNNAANHLGDNNHVAEMCLDKVGLLVRLSLRLGLAELLDQAHGAALETTVEPTTGTSMDEVAELFGGEVEEPEEESAVRLVFFILFNLYCYVLQGRECAACADFKHLSRNFHILVKLDTTVGELAERSLALELCEIFQSILVLVVQRRTIAQVASYAECPHTSSLFGVVYIFISSSIV